MKKELSCIMLVDDDQNDNFFHAREIKKTHSEITIIEKNTGLEALDYLKSEKENKSMLPDIIFLDLNMPVMNGWEFLQAYNHLDKELQSGIIIIMLSTSGNPEDIATAKTFNCVNDYITKPLTREIMENIVERYFKK